MGKPNTLTRVPAWSVCFWPTNQECVYRPYFANKANADAWLKEREGQGTHRINKIDIWLGDDGQYYGIDHDQFDHPWELDG